MPIYLLSQELPPDEVQVNLNGYFDNFKVNIVYPDISVKKSVGEFTSINARYLVDVISAASMKSHFDNVFSFESDKRGIDAYSSATPKDYGGGDNYPDDMRHEIAAGITQIFGEWTLSFNNIYSFENDYNSETIAFSVSAPFAKKNTTLNLGFVKSWDQNYPQIRSWTADKSVYSLTASLSQILSTKFIGQAEVFYSNMSGYLSDPYQVVTVYDTINNELLFFEPKYPDERHRYALGLRGIYQVGEESSLQLAYRIYDDSWNITSHTISGLYQISFLDEDILFSTGYRYYTQTPANFVKENYSVEEEYMSVDAKMKELFSNEFQIAATIRGNQIPYLDNENIKLNTRIQVYHRHTDFADWFSKRETLYALIFTFGFRYLF